MIKMIANMESFYRRIHDKLRERDKKRSWLLKKTGIKPSTWSSWEKFGRYPPADRALAIADALEVPVEFLVTGKETHLDARRSHPLVATILRQLEDLNEPQLQRVLIAVNTIAIEQPES